ncbi:MAG TPA: sigma-70 family RNA polymerase sigma factor, partial [Verrucomicrobiae bacterium]|nr:sigma-70 family RNA polymerase sigma factor [Verrucomicrobiae bacterium]
MQSMEDMELLREYVEHDSDIAFETILNRHINLVYSAAMRQVRDAAMAGEVTQITFIILARKARSLRRETVLSGWLYRTAQFAAARALRTEMRRRERELEAAKMPNEQTDSIWEQLAPTLDQAMAQLSSGDRNAIVLRYFENKT